MVLRLLRKYAQGKQYTSKVKAIDKVVIITGANTGIGKETALDLAFRGAKVYLACRDFNKCETACNEIIQKTGNKNIFNRELDLSSLESIRNFSNNFLNEEKKLDILINNAGVMNCPKSLTKDGFEMQIGVNHIGHFLLTNLLLDVLKKSTPSRIVVVSSCAYLKGKIKKDDLNSENSYSPLDAYCQSKLANILFTTHLSKKLIGSGVTCNALHPGVVRTELGRHIPSHFRVLMQPFRYFFKTPKSGAQTTIKLAVDPSLEKITGKFFDDCTESKLRFGAVDNKLAEWLWNTSEELVGLKKINS